MMEFVFPLAFHHKKGEYLHICRVFVFRGRVFLWLELVEFRLYLGASHCILFFQLLPCFLMGYSCQGECCFFFCYLILFLVSNCLLIYIYEVFIDICLYCVLFEIKNLICLHVIFPHMRLCILFSVSRNIQVDSIELLSILATDGQQLRLNLFYEHYFCKGLLFCKL